MNIDGWIGKVLCVTKSLVTMKYKKGGKNITENWDIECVRLADEVEIEDYNNEIKEDKLKSEKKKS